MSLLVILNNWFPLLSLLLFVYTHYRKNYKSDKGNKLSTLLEDSYSTNLGKRQYGK